MDWAFMNEWCFRLGPNKNSNYMLLSSLQEAASTSLETRPDGAEAATSSDSSGSPETKNGTAQQETTASTTGDLPRNGGDDDEATTDIAIDD